MRATAGRGRLSNHLNVAPIQELAFHVYGGMGTRFPQPIDEWFCGETTSTAAELGVTSQFGGPLASHGLNRRRVAKERG